MQGYSALGGAAAEKAMLEETGSKDPQIRLVAARSLGEIGSAAANDKLVKLVQDENQHVARTALASIAHSDPARAGQLAERQMKSTDVAARQSALQFSPLLEPAVAHAILAAGLADADESVAASAAQMYGQMGGAEAQNALVDCLQRDSASPALHRAAADALDGLGGSAARSYAALIAKYKSPVSDSPESGSGE